MKITIAVPVYNREATLKSCLDSLINQTMNSEEYEIICVDDCSNDKSLEILNEYKEKYNNLRIIVRENNSGGASEPRNDAIKEANGEYIFFVDSDDYIGEESLERMYKFASGNNTDVLVIKTRGVNGRGAAKSMFKNGNIEQAEIIENRLCYTLGPVKMFKRSFLEKNDIFFPTDIKVKEDQIFMMQAYTLASVISILADYDYYYAVKHDGNHLGPIIMPLDIELKRIARVIDVIEEGIQNINYRNKVKAEYFNRILTSDWTSFFYERKGWSYEQKKSWMNLFSDYLNNSIDRKVDEYILNQYKYKIKCFRENDLDKLIKLSSFEKNISMNDIVRVENGLILARYAEENKNNSFEEEIK
ncbi:glycosyltransferase involved in cell wall biosynthesis [Pullulanibacillus pueri]|uniref:Glycosyltransferase family 2 protein n=1 Tax=Pullulanibacillus pueri TaxID=1437324 RepID=A0A8J2ZTP3_9BACL|nr:glycosyltransferase family 2 protein [Pullulanibacillus pueri]MBM7683625.1 glycosyltransferase involved in cell wall biosynthesis [Pullulanibacillus pueri]GGH76600.1 hypothetical protein GCM10007096_07270 [Pullulanibacillus pueri]